MKPCLQCSTATAYKYCPECGQKQNIKRLTLSSFFSDFFSRVYGLDGAFPKTFIGLSVRPALVAKEYINGIRGKYVGPVGYYFLIFAIFLLIIQLSDYSLADYLPKTEELTELITNETDAKQTIEEKARVQATKQKVFGNIQYVHVALAPITAFFLCVFFRRSPYNFLEVTVFSFFIHAQAIFFNIFGFVGLVIADWKSNTLVSFLSLTYMLWSISLFYAGRVRFGSIAKGLLAYVLANISFIILTSIVVVIVLAVS